MKCLNNLSISQLIKLSQRFGLKPQYKNPQKRAAALRRCLRAFWRNNPIGECSICWEQIRPKSLCVTPCAHLFCNTCLLPYIRETEKCPLCRAECSYTHLIHKMLKIPEIVALLKRLVNIPRREEWAEEQVAEEEQVAQEEEISVGEETRAVIYHINIYIIIQNNLEKIYSLAAICIATFFAYYYYLQFIKRGVQVFYLCINIFTIFFVIYYALT